MTFLILPKIPNHEENKFIDYICIIAEPVLGLHPILRYYCCLFFTGRGGRAALEQFAARAELAGDPGFAVEGDGVQDLEALLGNSCKLFAFLNTSFSS